MPHHLFLATSFSGQVDLKTGQVLPVFRQLIENILTALRAEGLAVFCAVEHEDWIIADGAHA